MKNLLRSCFLAAASDSEQLAAQNYHAMVESGLGFDTPEDVIVWNFLTDFFKTYGHVPTLSTMRQHFTSVQEADVVDRLERLAMIKPRTRGDFLTYLEEKAKDRRNRVAIELLKEGAKIITTGVEIKDPRGNSTKLLGAIDAIRYVLDGSHNIVAPTLGSKLSGNLTQDGEDFQARYDRVKADPKYGIGQYCGISQIDMALQGAKRYELWIHAGFTGSMKCVAGDTEIWDLATGRMRTVKEIYDSKDLPVVHGLKEDTCRIVSASVSHVVEQGVRPIWKVKSEYGKEIRVSGNHPFLTPRGWVEAEELRREDWVAVPSELPNSVQTPFSDDEVEVLGYLLGDGCLKDDISLSNGNPGVLARFVEALNRMGYRRCPDETKYVTEPHYKFAYRRETCVGIRVSRSQGDKHHPQVSPLRRLLDRLGLYGTDAETKFVPPEMWAMTDEQVWVFLSALWSTDGHVGAREQEGRTDRPVAWVQLKSRRLVVGISRLLQRVGVPSSVRRVFVTYDGERIPYWQVSVLTNQGLRKFFEKASLHGKDLAVLECQQAMEGIPDSGDWCPSELLVDVEDGCRAKGRTGSWHYAKWAKRKEKINRDTFERLAVASENAKLISQARGQIRWERVAVERDGEEMTYDLSVPGIENFVANGFITHNSSFALHWAYIQAVYFGFSTVYFSLEMPYVQCRNIIYTMHTAHEDFAEVRKELGIEGPGLDYEKIRDGRLSPNEEKFLFEYVVPDLGGQSTVPHDGDYSLKAEEYGSIHLEVADPDKSDFSMADLRSRAELIFSKTPFSMIVVDHAGLMSARGRYSSTTEKLNEVVRDLKRLAMSFNRGMGIAVLCLFQISREGYRSAEKNGGRYNLTHLSYANECIVRTTKILCDSGMLGVEEVRPGTRVWSRSGWKPVLDFFDQGVRSVWRVTNDRGEQLEATANHRLRVLRDEQVVWSRVDELQEGDWLVSTEGDYPWPQSAPKLPGSSCLEPQLTETLAYLLGAWDGDGCYRDAKIAFTGNRAEKEVRNRIRSAFHDAFGEDLLSYEFDSRPNSFDEESLFNYERTRWFEFLGGPRGKKVPDIIFRAPRDLVLAYMKGLWDTDGWVNNQGVVGLKMKSETLLREIQLLMTALGIDTVLERNETTLKKTGKTYPGWTLRVRGTESKRRFQSDIGFSEPHKTKMLEDTFVETPKDKRMYPVGQLFAALSSDYTPYPMITSGRLKKSHYNATRKARIDGVASHGAIATVLRVMEEDGVEDPRAHVLREVLSRRVTQVSKIESDVREEHVYDLEVDGDHEFQTGPFLSHNCERSADIVTATWIDDALRGIDKAIFQCLKSRDQKPFERIPVKVAFSCRRLLTDHTPMSEVDEEVQKAKGGEDDDQKKWRKKARREQETPDLEI